MFLRRSAPCAALVALGVAVALQAHADTFTTSGIFNADNSTFEQSFTDATAQNFTAFTTSYATGGFVPVLTLYNATTGAEIDNSGSGLGDASFTDVLGPGSYDLFLTEFPNVAVGNLADGFLFANDPTATGGQCSVPGGMFLNTITCQPTSNDFTLTTTSTAVTPEPATWLLVLPPALLLMGYSSRRRIS